MIKLTNKEFNAKLSGFTRSMNSQRDNLQELIEAGLVEVKESGNTVYLTRVMDACVNVKALPTRAIKEYIKEHCSNLAWKKDKAGNMVFMKAKKGEVFNVIAPSIKWYEHESAEKAQATADLDETKAAILLLKRIEKNMQAHTVKDENKAKAIAEALKAIVA